jgi:hypothetical protein
MDLISFNLQGHKLCHELADYKEHSLEVLETFRVQYRYPGNSWIRDFEV